ncbi:hypothetical protein IW261DRAFT_1575102 [Armillaria novae-zelandiae]|uniref:RING-type domain-containing protein n=1 Tax=Armillaria novae-zelandiae TaxID=153914 RepID=A0AA39NFV0_9AGAR|nr:hypothetical protein IW261DRAFT_1575102 [Armillaria novae-zelandiae]
MVCNHDKPDKSDTDIKMNDMTRVSTNAAGSQSASNMTRTAGVKRKRKESDQTAPDVIEISSDEEASADKSKSTDIEDLEMLVKLLTKETGDVKRAQEQAERRAEQYHKALQVVGDAAIEAKDQAEQQVAKYKHEIKEHKDQMAKLKVTLDSIEEDTQCEICNLPLWYPYILPDCGHLFCERCIHNWVDTIMKVHRGQSNTQFFWSRPITIPPEVTRGMAHPLIEYRTVLSLFDKVRKAVEGPTFSCPQCRKEVKNRPVQVYAMKSITEKMASTHGENMPPNPVPLFAGRYCHWDEFFPFHYILNP